MRVTWDILQAVTAYGKPVLLSSLIQRDPHCLSIIDNEILRTAATSGQEDMLKVLSGMGAVDLETAAWRNISRVRNAALRGKTQALQELLSGGVTDLDLPDILGRTPLSLAATPPPQKLRHYHRGPSVGSGQEETVKILLKAGANIESKCHDGRMPLLCVAFEGYLAVVRILLDAGADVKVVNKNGKSAWDLARQGQYFIVAKILEDAQKD
ncbi:Ankyrin repeat domain-containing protein 50 [Varicellaria rhodocarpa]|nr:Ankyrin repeat domain-containing protein 50 [Varicellaria rhodocarpa]